MAADEISTDDWLLQGSTDPGEIAGRYDEWAESYDADLDSWAYQAPVVVARLVVTHHPEAGSVLDAGCGTGLVGRALRATGFTGRIEGLDVSRSSLRVAHRSGAYDALGPADLQQPLDVTEDAVDVLVCAGVMTYLPDVEAVWREFARVVRPGGLVVTTQREDLWIPRDCQGVIDRLEAEGVWTSLDSRGPAAYLPEARGDLAAIGCYYVSARIS
jgi:ubiquinone/menaquinone biosynthesis C-methylase UbiE